MRLTIVTAAILLLIPLPASAAAKKPKESPAVASMKKKLRTKVTADYNETRLEEVLDDLKKQVDNLSIWVDPKAGVSQNQKITYRAKDKPLETVLDEMFKKYDLGYVIGTKKYGRYEGWLIIKKGNLRGFEEEEKPAPTPGNSKDKGKRAEKSEEKPADDAAKAEIIAAAKLKLAKMLAEKGKIEAAKERYQEIIKKFPKTKAAKEARKLLEKLNQ